jgi:hypothetical protein
MTARDDHELREPSQPRGRACPWCGSIDAYCTGRKASSSSRRSPASSRCGPRALDSRQGACRPGRSQLAARAGERWFDRMPDREPRVAAAATARTRCEAEVKAEPEGDASRRHGSGDQRRGSRKAFCDGAGSAERAGVSSQGCSASPCLDRAGCRPRGSPDRSSQPAAGIATHPTPAITDQMIERQPLVVQVLEQFVDADPDFQTWRRRTQDGPG